jgi:HAD superfamily hydrolase (TIGR01509 family)
MEIKMKTYLFDFDGTLVDSMPIWGSVMKKILDEASIPYGNDIIKIITPLGSLGTARHFISMGHPLSEEELLKKMSLYLVDEYTRNVPAKEGVVNALKKMKDRGDSLNVLTASGHAALDPCLIRLGIFDIFDNVWSCDDFNTSKADPEIYRMAAERLGKGVGEVIFVDDNLNADMTAKKAGMTVVGIYDDSSIDYVDDIKKATDGYVYKFEELLNM